MSDTNAAAEVVADVAEEVADQATHVAEVSRDLSGRSLGLAFGGFVVGVGLGAAVGYILASRRLETKYLQIAEDEIAEMRKHYKAKMVALESNTDKGDLEKIVRERGYATEDEPTTTPPMAVTPPLSVVEAVAEEEDEEDEDEDEEVPAVETQAEFEARERNAFREFGDANRDPGEWDWHAERSRRSPLRPYVIHIDERDEREGYDGVTFTYFEADDVLCNERDEVVNEEDREKLLGEANLDKFGHGSNDLNCVYIRNDQLQMIFEVCKSPNSYVHEMGLEPEIRHSDRRRERMTFDDE